MPIPRFLTRTIIMKIQTLLPATWKIQYCITLIGKIAPKYNAPNIQTGQPAPGSLLTGFPMVKI
jgi:hypothetical protein